MRKFVAMVSVAGMMLAFGAGPAAADTLIGVNVCDTNILVENDDAASGQCVNQ